MIWLPVILLLLVPLALLGWLAMDGASSRVSWVLLAILVGAYLTGIALAGLWLVVPRPALYLYFVLYVAAVIRSAAVPRGMWPGTTRSRFGAAGRAVLAVAFVAFAARSASGYRTPAWAPELDFPLRNGIYLVANGGMDNLVNAHFRTLTEPRYRNFVGQGYGLDIVAVNRMGVRATGFLPANPARYRIFGDSVFAPCTGSVITAVDGRLDLSPPQTDRTNVAGNHVILQCGDMWVLLAHLQRGSVQVGAGDSVVVGRVLGRVGNSGNTSEPHLHIHAQRPGTESAPLGGAPIPVRFGGRSLVRNQRVVSR